MSIISANKKKIIFSTLATMIISIVCLFGLSACTWFTDDTQPGNSNYDANGNLRVASVGVSLIRPNLNGSVDENTGSFVWDLNYYIDGNKDRVKQEYDQSFYNTEFFDNTGLTAGYDSSARFLFAGVEYSAYGGVKYSVNESGYYKIISTSPTTVSCERVPSIIGADKHSKIKFLCAGTYSGTTQYTVEHNGYYLVDDVNGTTYAARVYTVYTDSALGPNFAGYYSNSLSDGSYNGLYVRYPSYTVSVSGISYEIRVNVNYENLIFDFNNNQMFKVKDGKTIDEVFAFSYRVGGNGNWQTDYDIATAFEKDGKFFVRFNPILTKGSTTRYIRVQTNASLQYGSLSRGSSVYTSPVNFNAYKMTFSVSCNNSVVADYEGLLYNSHKYYFANTEKSTNHGILNKDYYNSLTGYFVEGRIINVERYMAKDGDYAFQSWTINGKADNTVVMNEDVLPNNNGNYQNYATPTNNLACLNKHSTLNLGIFEVEETNVAALNLSLTNPYAEVLAYDVEDIDPVVGASATDPVQYNKGTLYAVSGLESASKTAFANTAKVKNFILSGTVYDGDKFFSAGGNAVLGDVDLYIWKTVDNGSGVYVDTSAPFAKFIASQNFVAFNILDEAAYESFLTSIGITDAEFINACEYNNSQFTIKNLAWNCYVSFGKIISGENDHDKTAYSFYSAAMEDKDGFYALTTKKEEFIISDRAGNAIIGTALAAESNVEVNIFVTDNVTGTLTPIDETKTSYNGIQYQVISTTKTQTDVFGYTTSSVIISLLLPSNCSLAAYNLESINSIGSSLYKPTESGATDYILCDIGYNKTLRINEFTFYHVTTSALNYADVSDGNTLNCLLYNHNYYQYTHRTQETNNEYSYYYEYATEVDGRLYRYIIKRLETTAGVSYEHFVYAQIKACDCYQDNIHKCNCDPCYCFHSSASSSSSSHDRIEVSYSITYNGKTYLFDSQTPGSDISVIATGHATELAYVVEKDGNTIKKTNPLFVYYNIKDYKFNDGSNNVTQHYYTAPIGQQTTYFESSNLDSAKTVTTWFHEELSKDIVRKVGLNDYKANFVFDLDAFMQEYNSKTDEERAKLVPGCVMLGADIFEIFNDESGIYDEIKEKLNTKFYQATDYGKSIIADNYYYVLPLGAANEILLSQYYSTDAETITTQEMVFFEYLPEYQESTEPSANYVYIDKDSDGYEEYVLDNGEYALVTPRYKKLTNAYYAYVDTNGDGVKEYVYDPDNNYAGPKFARKLYGNEVSIEPQYYSYAIGGLLESWKGENRQTVSIKHVKDGSSYKYVLEITKEDGTTEEVEVVTSMSTAITEGSTQLVYLYDTSSNTSYSLTAIDGDFASKTFIDHESKNTLIANINNVVYESTPDPDKSYYYFKERTYYNATFINAGVSSQKSLTVAYKFYTYNTLGDDIWESIIYSDGTYLYIDTGETVSITDDTVTPITITEYPVINRLTFDGNVYTYTTADGLTIQFAKKSGDNIEVINEFGNYRNVCLYNYYENNIETDKGSPTDLGPAYRTTIGYVTNKSFTALYYFNTAKVFSTGVVHKYFTTADTTDPTRKELFAESVTITRDGSTNKVVRDAVLASNTSVNIHLLGKVILLGDGEVEVYPSFDYDMPNNSSTILHIVDGEINYFTVDYTTTNAVIQAFPGVNILNGAPYVNPIMYFEVKHKVHDKIDENDDRSVAVIDIGLELVNGYYVEVISNAITSTTKNLIYDFSTISFKDTITNLTSNDYIDRLYYVLDKETQNSIIAYTYDGTKYTEYLSGTPLTIQNVGLNDDDTNVYSIMQRNEAGNYTQKLYYKVDASNYALLNTENLIIWSSSASAIEDVPIFDIHNYYISDNGMVILTSDGEENEVCSKIEDLFISGTGSTSSKYDYSEVMIGGFTSAYRVSSNSINTNSSGTDVQSFWWEDAINVANHYHSSDPYFLCGKEGVVLMASPIVELNDNGENIIYRFKRWAVYGRYNSEILYYNQDLSSVPEASNAVYRFTSNEAGYFVFMPIYEKVYTINVGTCIENGPLNLGGSVSVIYSGTSIDMEKSKINEDAFNVYFVDMQQTTQNDVTQYYYNNFKVYPYLYFDGTYITIADPEKPAITYTYPHIVARYDIVQLQYIKGNRLFTSYYAYNSTSKKIEQIPIVNDYSGAGIIEVKADNGSYTFNYKKDTVVDSVTINFGKKLPGYDTNIENLLSYGYSVNYYMDGVQDPAAYAGQSKVVFYYKKADSINDNNTPEDTTDDIAIGGYANGDNCMYAIDITTLLEMYFKTFDTFADFLSEILNNSEKFAKSNIKQFNSLASVVDVFYDMDPASLPYKFADGSTSFYVSQLARLASGELYSYINEETGEEEIYPTQQFKTSYFERDSKIIITASPDLGYRLKDWYLAEYNEKTNSWVMSSEALTDSINATYKDIIRNVYFNPDMGTAGTWYYVTLYSEEVGEKLVYYFDKEKTVPAVVPNSMLDSVRGYYAPAEDLYGNKYYIPVYRQENVTGTWYTDPTFTTEYTGLASLIEEKSHYECIRQWLDEGSQRFLLGNHEVYKHNGEFYRTKEIGNMCFSENTIYIYNLHNEIRVVAEFVEVYQSFVFAENSSDDNIEVVSLYYNTEGLRSNLKGENLDYLDKLCSTGMEVKDFENEDGNTNHINTTNYIGINNYNFLTQEVPLKKAQDKDEESGAVIDAKVNLVNMRFDVETTIFIVVKVYYNRNLNIHTLGMNTQYKLTPVFYPSPTYISENMAKSEDDRDEHYYYIFKVTFNRDLQYYSDSIGDDIVLSTTSSGNYNPEYVVHVQRKNAIVADVLNGNYSHYYSQLFDFYINSEKIELQFNGNNQVRFMQGDRETLKAKLATFGVATNTQEFSDIFDAYYPNIRDFFIAVRDNFDYVLTFDAVSDKHEYVYAGEQNNPTCSVTKIFNVITHKFKEVDKRIREPIASGSTNFINLSSIPVYTYTTQIKVLSGLSSDNDNTEFDTDMEKVLAYYGVRLKQALYTRGGYYGYTYVGTGTENAAGQSITVNDKQTYYPHKFTGNVDEITADSPYVDMFEQDYALAKDTIMVLGGIEYRDDTPDDTTDNIWKQSDGGVYYAELPTSDGQTVKYVFTGWFEQKMITDKNNREVWGDLQLMSNAIDYPFASVAYANTNIIALFERAVDVEICGDKNSLTANFNSIRDSLNNSIKIEPNNDRFKISGTFTISTNLQVEATPSGSYRFGNEWDITVGDNKFNNTINLYNSDDLVSFAQKDVKDPKFEDLNLVKTSTFGFVVGEVLNTSGEGKPTNDVFSSLAVIRPEDLEESQIIQVLNQQWQNNVVSIEFNMTQVQLTYITVEGYSKTVGSTEKLSGYEFILYYKPGNNAQRIVETEFVSATKVNNKAEGIKDSAQRPIRVDIINHNLCIYGYFDFDVYTDNLYIYAVEKESATLKAWYINTHSETTNALTPYAIKPSHWADGGMNVDAFKLSYVYTWDENGQTNLELYDQNAAGNPDVAVTENLVNQYNNEMFNLSNNNFAYMLTAKIEAKSDLSVSYATAESLKDLDEEIDFATSESVKYISQADKGSIAWTGALFTTDAEGNEITTVNGVENFVDTIDNGKLIPTSYSFFSRTKVTLSNKNLYYSEDNTTFYKFLGWFTYKDNKLLLVDESVTLYTQGSGNYVALFVKLVTVTDVYTYTLNTATGNKNLNANIEVSAAYEINKYSISMSNGQVSNNEKIAINVYGTCPSFENLGNTIPSFKYAMVGCDIKVDVVADDGYLVGDIVYKVNESETETSILEGLNGNISGFGYIKNVGENGEERYEIIGYVSRGYDINIVIIYFDNISMTSTGLEYHKQNLVTISRADVPEGSATTSAAGIYSFSAGTKINLIFNEIPNDVGLIGYYVDGRHIPLATDENGALLDLGKRLAQYEVNQDTTIEVRITKYVKVRTMAVDTAGKTLAYDKVNSGFEYKCQYSGETRTYLATSGDHWHYVLSGTILTFDTHTTESFAFTKWTRTESFNNTLIDGKQDIEVSGESQFELTVDYGADGNNYQNSAAYAFVFTACYQSAHNLYIDKFITSYNVIDSDYRIENPNGSITWAPEFWANLDVAVEYTDINGETHTIYMGSTTSLEDKPLKLKADTTIKIMVNISKAVENRYSATIKLNSSAIENGSTHNVDRDQRVVVEFYATRNITLVRQVNNTEVTSNKLNVSFSIGGSFAVSPETLAADKTRNTWTGVPCGTSTSITANQHAEYTFAGFYINGRPVGTGYISGGECSFAIIQGEYNLTTTQLQTYDTDLTIVALWYTTSGISASVYVDGVDILSSDSQAKQPLKDLSNQLFLTLVGNKTTYNESTHNYNTTLQTTVVDPTNRNDLLYVAGQSLALIASHFAGYQFVGFYYKDITTNSNYIKLDFANSTSAEYNYGDTISSIIAANTFEQGHSYHIEARYVTAWQLSQLSTVINQSNVKQIVSTNINSHFVQLAYVSEEYIDIISKHTAANQYANPTFAGTTKNERYIQYFYPQYSTLVGVYFDSGYANNIGVTSVGFYINGKFIASKGTVELEYQGSPCIYHILDINDYLTIERNSSGIYDINNLVVENKFVKNVDYVVRIGIDNTSDIDKLNNASLNLTKIKITYTNPYSKQAVEKTYLSSGPDTFWNTSNRSLYIKLSLPIGTQISTQIIGDTIKDALQEGSDNQTTYHFNGWFLYSNHSIAASTSVINYTNTVNFTLTNDTDIVAQYYSDKISKSTDTQFSYKFNGDNFDAGLIFSPAIQGNFSNVSEISKQITAKLLELNNTTKIFDMTFSSNVSGHEETITIKSNDGIIFEITHTDESKHLDKTYNFMFMGWMQEIKNSLSPSTFLYITSDLGLNYASGLPHQMKKATNMIAVFTQIVTLKLDYADGEAVNSLNYTKLLQNYSQVAPTLMNDTANLGNYLYTALDNDGALTWTTLYTTNLYFNYYAVYGYHYDNNLDSPIADPWSEYKTAESDSKDDGLKQDVDTTTATATLKSAIQYLQGYSNAKIAKTKYKYSVSSKDYNITAIKSTMHCPVDDHKHTNPAALTTSVLNAGGKASLARAFSYTAAAAVDDDIVIESSDESVKAFIGGHIVTPNDITGISFALDIRFPDGTTATLVLNQDALFNMLLNEGDSTLRELPLGTTIHIQTLISKTNRNETLEKVQLYYFDNETDFRNENSKPSDPNNIVTLNWAETDSIVITEELNNKYLRIVVIYKNVFNIELKDNNLEQGIVAITYKAPTAITTSTSYNINLNTLPNYSFNDLLLEFVAGLTMGTTPLEENVSLFELLKAFNANANNFTDILRYIKDEGTQSQTSGNWTMEISFDGTDYSAKLVYTYNEIDYVTIEISKFIFNGVEDDLHNTYVVGFEAVVTLNTSLVVTPDYLHVTTVNASYSIERFDPNSETFTSTQKGDKEFKLYVFDNNFFIETTYTPDGAAEAVTKYVFIKDLDALFDEELKEMTDLVFLGYSYAGGLLSVNSLEMYQHLVITPTAFNNGNEVNDIILIEAIFVESIKSNVGLEIDYYNNEMDESITDNPNLLNTPLDKLAIFINSIEQEGAFSDVKSIVEVSTNLNTSSDLTVLDKQDYFSFIKWVFKYNVGTPENPDYKFIATNNAGTIEYYSFNFAALNVDSNLYVNLVKKYKESKDYTLDTTKYAKYTEGEEISISNFILCAYIKEEVVELTFDYQYAGETFNIAISSGSNPVADIRNMSSSMENIRDEVENKDIELAHSNMLIVGRDGDVASGFPYSFLINQVEIPAESLDESNEYKLLLVYSRGMVHVTDIGIVVQASQYNTRAGEKIGKTLDAATAVRQILPTFEDGATIKPEYGQSRFYKLNGFKDDVSNVMVVSHNGTLNAISIKTDKVVHSTSYLLDLTNMYLVEIGMAMYVDGTITNDNHGNVLSINGMLIDTKHALDSNESNYGSLSFLFEKGEIINVEIQNKGNDVKYVADPADGSSHYRGMAISHNYGVADLYKLFKNTLTVNPLDASDATYADIYQVPKQVWREALGMDLANEYDYSNDYFTTLYQESGYYISAHAEKYTFIAVENTSIVADYIGLFKEQKKYISVLLNADESVKYVNNSAQQESHIGENFVITIAYNNTLITLDQVLNDDIKYSLIANYTIVKSSVSDQLETDVLKFDTKLDGDGDVVPYIEFTSRNHQLAIGLVTNKYVSAEIGVMMKYINYNPTIIRALAKALERIAPSGEEPVAEDTLLYGWNNSYTMTPELEVYMLDLGNLDLATYITNHKTEGTAEKYPLTTNLEVKKDTRVALIAEKREGFTFAGFKIVSQTWDLMTNNMLQNVSTSNTMYIAKQTTAYTIEKIQLENNSDEKEYYVVRTTLDGNAKVIALYEPNIYLLNIAQRSYDEKKTEIENGSSFKPNPITDPATTQGKIATHSLVISSGDIIELTILTNGFSEYKGITTANYSQYDKINAIYSTSGTLNNTDLSTITKSKNDNAGVMSAIEKFDTDRDLLEYSAEDDNITYLHYSSDTPDGEDISEDVTRGFITADQLFTKKYSTNNNGVFEKNLASTSYLYLFLGEVDNDVDLFAYFNAIYYSLDITLNEFESGYTDEHVYKQTGQIDDKYLGNSPYIAYSEEYRSQDGWKNPSASLTYGIEENDPYVYTWYDYTGKLLSSPIKLTRAMVSQIVPNEEYNYLTLRQPENDSNTIKNVYTSPDNDDEYRIALSFTDEFDKVLPTIDAKFTTPILKDIYNYVNIDFANGERYYKLVDGLFSVSIDGCDYIDSGDLPKTDYQYISEDYQTVELNNIKITDLASLSVNINMSASNNQPSIVVSIKVFADPNSGFPGISVIPTSTELCGGAIQFQRGYVADDFDGVYTEPEQEQSDGFSDYYFQDAFIADEETGYLTLDRDKYPTLSLNANLIYSRLSKYAEGEVAFTYDGSKPTETNTVMLTNPDKLTKVSQSTSVNQNEILKSINYKYHSATNEGVSGYCTQCQMHHNCVKGGASNLNCNMIDRYYFYYITNAQLYIDALEEAADRGIISKITVANLIAELLAFNPASNLGKNIANSTERKQHIANPNNYDTLEEFGDIFDYVTFSKITLKNLLWAAGYNELWARLNDKNNNTDLHFKRLDVFANFNNKVNKNFFGNSLSYGDMLVTVCKLTEHEAPHRVNYIADGSTIWEEYEAGYMYVNTASGDYNISTKNDAYYSKSSNNFAHELSNASVIPTNHKYDIVRWLAGISNSVAKYADSFTYVVHSGIIPETGEFVDRDKTTFINTVMVDLRDDVVNIFEKEDGNMTGRIKTSHVPKVHGNIIIAIGEAIVGLAIIAAGIVIIVYSGGAAAVIAGILVIIAGAAQTAIGVYDGIMVFNGYTAAELTPLHNALNNLDFKFGS